jgi:hypothetical protein
MNRLTRIASAVAAALLIARAGAAEKPVASALATSEAERLVGDWTLSFSTPGGPTKLGLTVADIGGFLGATLDSAKQPEPRALETIAKTAEGIDFQFEMPFGEQKLTMHLVVAESAGKLAGTLSEQNKVFSTAVTGERGRFEVAAADRASPTEAQLKVAGKKIRITFGNLNTKGEDYPKLASVPDGAIFRFVGSRATKLYTDTDLAFGDTVVKAANVSPGYPGVYSLWLKRAGDSWKLVVNNQPDVWGTQHDPAHDIAEIQLQASTRAAAQDEFRITLDPKADGGVVRLAWGNTEWSTPFNVVQ